MPLPIVDTRRFFHPLTREIVAVLRSADDDQWERQTLAGSWQVRDVAAHLIDTALRRLSFHRDGASAPRPSPGQDFVAFINELNATWTRAARRLSPRVLTGLYAEAGSSLAEFVETLDLEAPAFFPVSWAGGDSRQWLDIGREFTEVWHHGAQIRDALGAGPFSDPEWLRAVLQIAMHALPHAYQDVAAADGASVTIRVSGPSSGAWTLQRSGVGWSIDEGEASGAAAAISLDDEIAWRVLFNALPPSEAEPLVRIDGNTALGRRILHVRAVIV
ncbi:MAG TPA: maleylpyruvate isomerase family mycothiol-dependent enzyme [Vicinamibacterales bacterium]|nr:maleylpyruvate isomerase family mycothiol-dependent enzyme [Vicinamibacterales bacterium]